MRPPVFPCRLPGDRLGVIAEEPDMQMMIALSAAAMILCTAAKADTRDRIIEECHAQLQLGDGGCTCIADKADAELSADQQDFLIAQVTDDQAATQAATAKLTVAEMTQVGLFMQQAPATCAGQ